MRSLAVFLNGQQVGILEQDEAAQISFTYGRDWLTSPHAIPLSRSLPLQAEPFVSKRARAFFAGVLPDHGPRQRIAQTLGISADNDFAMLEKIGGECAGAVSLLPVGMSPPQTGAVEYRELDDRELRKVLDELPSRPLLAGSRGLRLSLAGAQDKLPILVRDGRMCLPLGDTSSTHILKPEPERFAGLAANELLCMRLGSKVGLRVPGVEYRTAGNTAFLLIERYDREPLEGTTTVRVHQEDFCQALGLPPETKYEEEGGPRIADCVGLLRDWSTRPAVDIPLFLDGLVFSAVVGNADAHGKNFSILYREGQRELAPFYDLVCTLAWPSLSQNLAMRIGGWSSLDSLRREHWRAMAQECGLGWPPLRERIARVCQVVLDTLETVAAEIAETGTPVPAVLCRLIPLRARSILQGIRT